MSWTEKHTESEGLAAQAETATRKGDKSLSLELYHQAAEAEAKALQDVDFKKSRTLGITVISAASLYYKAQEYLQAEQVAYSWLNTPYLPAFATEQLQILLQTIWSNHVREQANVKFIRGEVLVSVKGGEIVSGGAPLDLIVRKVENIQALFYRATEFIKGLPHRKHGPAGLDIQKLCRPWLFQTVPGSYQFAVAIQESTQTELIPTGQPSSEEITTAFLKILRASIEDPDRTLLEIVPDSEYRGTFLKLARNLAPSGKVFEEIEVKAVPDFNPISITPSTRMILSEVIRKQFPKAKQSDVKEVTLEGILRAVHLDEDWLEVTVGIEHIRILEAKETVDDVVGPMVNRQVIVQALRKPTGQYTLLDIQAAE
jgi:hypothetical protein